MHWRRCERNYRRWRIARFDFLSTGIPRAISRKASLSDDKTRRRVRELRILSRNSVAPKSPLQNLHPSLDKK
jgi:hypothetical protein